MPVPSNKITAHLAQNIFLALETLHPGHGQDTPSLQAAITSPPKPAMGHFCLPCFPLARALKSAPAKIARSIAGSLATDEVIAKVSPEGPYLNVFVSPRGLVDLSLADILGGSFFQGKPGKRHLLIEYSQPNTHKIIHVGHMRNLCLGDALVRMIRYGGDKVTSATYPGDVGTHVAKCLWYLDKRDLRPPRGEEPGQWLGKIYSEATRAFEQASAQDKGQVTEILTQISQRQGKFFQLWQESRQWSVDLMKSAYAWTGVRFDRWYWESEVDRPSLEYARKLFAEGKLIKDQGAIGMDLSEDKLGFCMLIKRDGTGLYATKDLLLAQLKFEEYNPDQSIHIVDNRQSRHFQQIFKTLGKLGHASAAKCLHLAYEMVELPSGPMSSRQGNIVPLMELVQDMQDKVSRDHLNKYRGLWPEGEIKQCASMVAAAAIKYGMLRVDTGRKIVFAKEEWLKLDGETGPYLQYVHARIQSMLEKIGPCPQEFDPDQLVHPGEIALMVKLACFNDTVARCVDQLATMPLCAHLYRIARLFNAFYTDCPIAKAQTNQLRVARAALARATGQVMRQGLDLLGIPAPLRM